MCFEQRNHDIHVPKEVEELLLKFQLVHSSQKVEALYRSLNDSAFAQFGYEIGLFYATKLIDVLTQKDIPLEPKEVSILFEILLDLFSCCRDEDLEVFAVEVHECFKLLSDYHRKEVKTSLSLPVEIHRKAFEICEGILIGRHTSAPAVQSIVFALAHVINHKDFAAGEQLAFVSAVQSFGLNHKISTDIKMRAFSLCTTFENVCPCFQSVIVDKLLRFVREKNPTEMKLKILKKLPFDPNFINMSVELHAEAVNTLVHVMLDKTEDISVREGAAEGLCYWVWSCQKFQSELNSQQLYVIGEMVKLIMSYKVTGDEVVKKIVIHLFEGILDAEHWHPTGKYLLNVYKELACEKEFPWALKLNLADHMPKGCCDFGAKKPNAIDLFFFMVEKLSDPKCDMSLKRMYVQRLISCYLSEETTRTVGCRNGSVGTIEDFMNLEIFKKDPELSLTASLAYNKLFDPKTAYKSIKSRLIYIA